MRVAKVKKIDIKREMLRYLQLLIGLVLTAFAFNIFVLPVNTVCGVSGISVMLNSTFGTNPAIVILLGSGILLIFSFFLLGFKQTKGSILGSLLYPLFVEVTSHYTKFIDLGNTETVVLVIFGAVIYGFGLGIIMKVGFTTGGTDILNQIVSKYFNMSMGKAIIIIEGMIIVASLFVFGWQSFIYSIIFVFIISFVIDRVLLGISDSKCFYIITENETSVKKFIIDDLGHGITVLEARGGYTGNNKKVIMCIIPNKQYFVVKEGIKKIDNEAFLLVTDSYEVLNGK